MSINEKVWKNSLETCEYLSGYENTSSTIQVKCIKHNFIFHTKYENVRRDNRAHYICPKCQEEAKNDRLKNNRTKVTCSYCGKEFYKQNSKLDKSKSGLYFCCREHKDLAQKIESDIPEIWPDHYQKNATIGSYRKKAFLNYPHKCAICNWNEDPELLEVHHIDENRLNNDLNNLIILCPICHRKLTNHNYILIDRKSIIKI